MSRVKIDKDIQRFKPDKQIGDTVRAVTSTMKEESRIRKRKFSRRGKEIARRKKELAGDACRKTWAEEGEKREEVH